MKKLNSIAAFATRLIAIILFAFFLMPAAVFAQDELRLAPEEDKPRARMEYLVEMRGGQDAPNGAARLKALRQFDEMVEEEGRRFWMKASMSPEAGIAGVSANTTTWLNIGPNPTVTNFCCGSYQSSSGRISALAVDPTDATGNTVYMGAAQGGIWKTTNGGSSWTALTDSQASLATGAIAVDTAGYVYVGTGEQSNSSDSYYGAGVLKSTDGGTSWTQLGASLFAGPDCTSSFLGCGGARFGGLSIQPGSNNVILAAVETVFTNFRGIFRSTDGGVTWSDPPVLNNSGSGSAVAFATANIAYAGLNGTGVYKSIDGGATWAAANGNGSGGVINTTGIGRVEIAVAKGDTTGNTVFASIANTATSGLDGLYKTVDGGLIWTKLGPAPVPVGDPPLPLPALVDYCTPQCWYDNLVIVHPTNSNLVFVGGGAPSAGHLLRSIDGGSSWTRQDSAIHVDHHAAAFTPDGNTLYWGNDGGAYKTTGPTATSVVWTNINAGLSITQFYSYFGLHPTNINITFGGAQDNSTQKYDGTQSLANAWNWVTCGDGASGVIDWFDTTRVFANCQNIDIRRSLSSGNPGTFSVAETGIDDLDRKQFIPPMIGDGNTAALNRIYFGAHRVWESRDSAGTWTAASTDVTGTNGATGTGTITNLALSLDRQTMYTVSSGGRVYKATDIASHTAGVPATFTDVTGSGLPATRANAIGIHPTDSNIAYVVFAGFATTGINSHVFKTTVGGGGTWTNVTNNLPNTPVNDVVVDPDAPNTVYVGTDIGVFRSTDAGATWSTLGTGLPRVAVFGIKLHRASRTLRVATHGRGFWDLSVPANAQAPVLALSTANVTFATQQFGTTSAAQTVTLTAQNGAVTGISTGITGDFARTTTCGTSLNQGTSCTVSVTFTPTTNGSRSGTLSITSSGTGSPQAVNLLGTGTTPIAVVANVMTLSAVINRRSPLQIATFSNYSGGSITVSAVNNTNPTNFPVTSTCVGTVANFGNCTVSAVLLTASSGALTPATITIAHNGAGGNTLLTLNGTGVDFNLNLTRGSRPARPGADIVIGPGETVALPMSVEMTAPLDESAEIACSSATRGFTCQVPSQVSLATGTAPFVLKLSVPRAGIARLGRRVQSATVHVTATVAGEVRTKSYTVRVEGNTPPAAPRNRGRSRQR